MIRRPPRSTLDRSSAASDVYKRQAMDSPCARTATSAPMSAFCCLSLIHISEPTRQAEISYAVFCLKKKKKTDTNKRPTDNQEQNKKPKKQNKTHLTHP